MTTRHAAHVPLKLMIIPMCEERVNWTKTRVSVIMRPVLQHGTINKTHELPIRRTCHTNITRVSVQ